MYKLSEGNRLNHTPIPWFRLKVHAPYPFIDIIPCLSNNSCLFYHHHCQIIHLSDVRTDIYKYSRRYELTNDLQWKNVISNVSASWLLILRECLRRRVVSLPLSMPVLWHLAASVSFTAAVNRRPWPISSRKSSTLNPFLKFIPFAKVEFKKL